MTKEGRKKIAQNNLFQNLDPEYIYMGVKKKNLPKLEEEGRKRFSSGDGKTPLPEAD